jgi:enterochelin esterase family protein
MERTTSTRSDVGETLTFRMPDPERRLSGVRLQQDVRLPGDLLDFARDGDDWVLSVPRPDVDRMEYSFELHHDDGGVEWVCDPGNPRRVGGAFGDKSVLEMPGYSVPKWLDAAPPRGSRRDVGLPSRGLAHDVPAVLWASAGSGDEDALPLLVVHDGPEYDALASLTLFLDAMVDDGRLPPMRAALLAPVDRNESYAASTPYSRALALGLVPALHKMLPTSVTLGMGASLGGLAMLHAQRAHVGTFAGLYLQSSSFFHRDLDGQESSFERFQRVTAFVESVLRSGPATEPVPIVLTCGLIEENVENNRLMTRSLAAQGYDTRLVENRDVHTYTGWRDTFDPHLVDLVQRVLDGEQEP